MSVEDDLCYAWLRDELKQEDILTKVQQLIREEFTPALPEDAEHLARMIFLLYESYYDRYDPEDFLKALKNDSFRQVMNRVDNINLRGLMIIHKYLYNYAPGDWRIKGRRV